MPNRFFIAPTVLILSLCATGVSLAGEPTSDFGPPATSAQLGDLRGGFVQVNNDMQLTGVTSNNLAIDVKSGSNFIASGSFANSSGFPMVVQNSGSNVLIQNATIINLQLQ